MSSSKFSPLDLELCHGFDIYNKVKKRNVGRGPVFINQIYSTKNKSPKHKIKG